MNRNLTVVLSLLLLLLVGCGSEPVREGVDASRAAVDNANLGLRYMQMGNYERALSKLEKAISFDNSYAPAHHYTAELYKRLGEHEKAEEAYRNALRYAEKDSSLYNNFGGFLCSRERYDEGEKMFLKVLENPVYPRKDQVYENLGLCVEAKPDYDKAETYLRSALRINARLPKSLLAMARLSMQKNNYLSTRAYLQRYLELARHTPETLWLGIRAERMLGDQNAVASYGLLLRSNFPDAPETKLYLESGN